MADDLSVKELSDSILPKEDLVKYLCDIITEIRKNDLYGKELKEKIHEMEEYVGKVHAGMKASQLYPIYEKIQEASMELRKLLSDFIELDLYDGISYSIYYNGKRYAIDNLKQEWLTESRSSGELKLRLNAVEKELKDAIHDEYKQALAASFNKHYATFKAAIEGTYNGVIGRGGALNVGHIAEAFEAHSEEHHKREYSLLNNLFNSEEELTVADKMLIQYESEADAVNYWANHEGISAAWMHIRESLGTQRGTVAGDVLGRQVKQGKSSASRIRLARLGTLQRGIEDYSAIIGDGNNNPPVEEVAERLAEYISEPMRQMSVKIIDNIALEDIKEEMYKLNDKYLNTTMIHI